MCFFFHILVLFACEMGYKKSGRSFEKDNQNIFKSQVVPPVRNFMHIAGTIIPIFSIVIIGWLIRLKGFIPPEFLGPANRLVFYIAIPAMIFRAISKASFKAQFNLTSHSDNSVFSSGRFCCFHG